MNSFRGSRKKYEKFVLLEFFQFFKNCHAQSESDLVLDLLKSIRVPQSCFNNINICLSNVILRVGSIRLLVARVLQLFKHYPALCDSVLVWNLLKSIRIPQRSFLSVVSNNFKKRLSNVVLRVVHRRVRVYVGRSIVSAAKKCNAPRLFHSRCRRRRTIKSRSLNTTSRAQRRCLLKELWISGVLSADPLYCHFACPPDCVRVSIVPNSSGGVRVFLKVKKMRKRVRKQTTWPRRRYVVKNRIKIIRFNRSMFDDSDIPYVIPAFDEVPFLHACARNRKTARLIRFSEERNTAILKNTCNMRVASATDAFIMIDRQTDISKPQCNVWVSAATAAFIMIESVFCQPIIPFMPALHVSRFNSPINPSRVPLRTWDDIFEKIRCRDRMDWDWACENDRYYYFCDCCIF